jgi:hypothetical protein
MIVPYKNIEVISKRTIVVTATANDILRDFLVKTFNFNKFRVIFISLSNILSIEI